MKYFGTYDRIKEEVLTSGFISDQTLALFSENMRYSEFLNSSDFEMILGLLQSTEDVVQESFLDLLLKGLDGKADRIVAEESLIRLGEFSREINNPNFKERVENIFSK